MSPPEHAERRNSLVDYARGVRRHRLLLLVVTAIFVVGFVGYSLTKPKTYKASSTVLFQDPSQDLSLTGVSVGIFRTAQELAQIGAQTIIDPQLAAGVQHRLDTRLSARTLANELSATSDPSSGEVTITATGPRASFVANLANAAAKIGASSQAAQERSRYAAAAGSLQQRVKRLGKSRADTNQRLTYDDQIARLRALSVLAQPVQVTSLATPPQSPSSPKPFNDGILGLILGLVVGSVASAVREAFDRRLRSTGDVADVLDLPILAHVGEDAMGKAGLSHSGLGALSDAEVEAFRTLRANLRFRGGGSAPKSVLVTSPMPKEGKSTVAASLAFSYALAGQKTLLIECDFRRPSLAGRLGIGREPGLIDFLLGHSSPEEVVQLVPDALAQPVGNGTSARREPSATPLAAIVAGPLPRGQTAELFETGAFAQFIEQVSQVYDVIVIDTAPLLPVADTLELIHHVDSIVLCARSAQTTRHQAMAGKSALEPTKDRVAGVVVTGVSERDRGSYGYYGYYGYAYSRDTDGAQPASTSHHQRLRDRLSIGRD